MNKTQKLQKITEAIHKVCPDLLELRFGTKIKEKDCADIGTFICQESFLERGREEKYRIWCEWNRQMITMEYSMIMTGQGFDDRIEILGQPITLPAILRAIEKRYKEYQFATIASNGWFHFGSLRCFFDLTKTLDQQEEPVISLLYSILCQNE